MTTHIDRQRAADDGDEKMDGGEKVLEICRRDFIRAGGRPEDWQAARQQLLQEYDNVLAERARQDPSGALDPYDIVFQLL